MTDPPSISVGHTLSGRQPTAQYRVVERLGAGGVGTVYRVIDHSGESFALKALHRSHAYSSPLRRRFEREAQALEALSHPNVVQIVDHGSFNDEPYLVMELLLGESLSERLRRGRLNPQEVRRLAEELLAALSYVHEQGLVHRDLKPGNVFLQRTEDGRQRCKVLDFGFVKFIAGHDTPSEPLTRSGEIFGTPAYMAPEQMGGEATNARTDVYALGVLLYEMVTGKRPFDGDVTDIMRGHLVEEPPGLAQAAPGLKPCEGLPELIERALRKRADERFADAGEMRAAFEALPDVLFEQTELADAASIEHASTLVPEQAAALGLASAAKPVRRARRPGLLATIGRGLRALFRKLLTASAVALIVASLVVIVFSAVTIYGLRDVEGPQGTPSPTALADEINDRLQQTREALEDTLGAATPSVPPTPTLSPEEELAATLPPLEPVVEAKPAEPGAAEPSADPPVIEPEPEPEPEPESESEAAAEEALAVDEAGPNSPEAETESPEPETKSPEEETDTASSIPSTLPRARDPFRRSVPRELRRIARSSYAGAEGSEGDIRRLRTYNRLHPRDPRGHIVLARLYFNRGWRQDAFAQYELVGKLDPAARGAKRMRADLKALAAHPTTAKDATALLEALYRAEP